MDWQGLFAADAALLIVEGLKAVVSRAEDEAGLADVRSELRDWLAGRSGTDTAVDGFTGATWFDQNGDPYKPITLGYYDKGVLVSTPQQLRKAGAHEQMDDSTTFVTIGDDTFYRTRLVSTGIDVRTIRDINEEEMTAEIECDIWFRGAVGIDPSDIQFLNAVGEVDMSEPLAQQEHNGIEYSRYSVAGTFALNYLSPAAYDELVVGLGFRHNTLDNRRLVYVTDLLGMPFKAEAEKLAEYAGERALSRAESYWIRQAMCYQDATNVPVLGDMRHLGLDKGLVQFSSFNLHFRMRPQSTSLRGAFSADLAWYIVAGVLVAFFVYARWLKGWLIEHVPRVSWVSETICGLSFVLALETAVLNEGLDKLEPIFLANIVVFFDMLWWLVPAFLWTLELSVSYGSH